MALIKNYKTRIGVEASYWRIGGFAIDTNMKETNFHFNLYVDKSAEQFIESYSVTELLGIDDKTMYNKYFAKDRGVHYKDWQTACYMYAKECVSFFADAIDDDDEIAASSKLI